VERRTVLDVGACSGFHRADWMHAQIASVAREVVGVDVDEELAQLARSQGFDIVVGDAQSMDLGRSFDVVWAGEVIEHLSCPGAFLDATRRHLGPNGLLVVTTPNVFAVSNFVYRIGGRPRMNKGHVAWYDETTLRQLLERHRFRVVEVAYVGHRTPGALRAALARSVRSCLPQHLAENTLLMVASAASPN
jgi:2-polyprenyl-3-methyl-5-hydroxy-6-metoxy-1,4-benzoquinol methylase